MRLAFLFLMGMLLFTAKAKAADVDYVVTTSINPVKPGQIVEFDVTVRNLSNTAQAVTLNYSVPPFTSEGGNVAGTPESISFGTIAVGATQTRAIRLTVLNGNNAPADGTLITLMLTDQARGPSVERTVTVQSIQALALRISTNQATVAPGGQFSYTLDVSNISAAALSGVQLSVPVPTGATFVSADGGGSLNSNVVTWNLGTLGAAASRKLHLTLQASALANDPLAAVVATLTDGSGATAVASDARAVEASQDFDYTVTTPTDPARPGDIVEFDVTVHNRTNSTRSVRLDYTVPLFTNEGGNVAGTADDIFFSNVDAGGSRSAIIRMRVLNGNFAPPNASLIELYLMDQARGASVSRTIGTQSTRALDLQLSTANATVMPGQQFTYTFLASNVTGNLLSGLNLQVPVPMGATFVSADAAGSLSNNIVTWNLGNVAAGTFRQVHVTFQANSVTDTSLLLIEASLRDSLGRAAYASDTRAVDPAPAFDYTVTTPSARVKPGDVVDFTVVIHNRSNSDRPLRLDYTVPLFTSEGGNVAGTADDIFFGTVLSGATQSRVVHLTISTGNDAPQNGTTITLNLIDQDRGASVSRSIVLSPIPKPRGDFNNGGRPDWVLVNPTNGQTKIVLLNDTIQVKTFAGRTLPAGWRLIDADQFGVTVSSDFLLFNPSTRAVAIWYMNGAAYFSGGAGPKPPAGWTLVLSQDFNGDGHPDLLLYNPSTHQTAIWYLNGLQYNGGGFGPTLPAGWVVIAADDFNQDGSPDLLIYNAARRITAIWYLSGLQYTGSAYGPALAAGWAPSAVDDFNRDGHPDLAITNASTHQSAIWHLNNNVLINSKFGPMIPAGFVLSAPK